MKTAAKTAPLADEYVLMPHGDCECRARDNAGYRGDCSMLRPTGKQWEEGTGPCHGKPERPIGSQLQFDPSKVCNYCKGRGHWKAECPVKSTIRSGISSGQVKSVALAAPVRNVSPVISSCDHSQCDISPCNGSSCEQMEPGVECSLISQLLCLMAVCH